jgi:nitroimidazol reductase NimA-like FMN-containing flavoprotein (pyridoxamine 5'-phosphate oxidase superfamily)
MRRKDKQIKDDTLIEEIFHQSQVCRLGIHDQPAPYVIPFNYGYKNRTLYIHTARTGKSIDLLRKNPVVGFEIEQDSTIVTGELSCEWTTRYRSLIGLGKAEIIDDFGEKQKALDLIMAHYGRTEGNTYEDKFIRAILIIKVVITDVKGKQSGDWPE